MSDVLVSDDLCDQQVITLEAVDDLLAQNQFSPNTYINIEYTTCDQTSDRILENNCIESDSIEIGVTNAVNIDGNSAQSVETLVEKSSEIKTYSRNK